MRQRLIAAVAGSCLVGAAYAQPMDMYVVSSGNLDAVCDINNPNFWVGSIPSAIALNGNTLFVAGFDNGGSGSAIPNRVVKVGNVISGTRTFDWLRNADGSAYQIDIPTFRGYNGMAYRPGSGLLMARDMNGPAAGSLCLFDVDSQVNPIKITENNETFFRGGAGPAWDGGFDNAGYPANYNGLGVPAAAAPAVPVVLDFSQPTNVKIGPFALDVTNNMSINVGLTVFEYLTPGDNNLRLDFAGIPGTFWRDCAVHPTNGAYAARANNALVIGTRPSNNKNFASQVLILGDNGNPVGQQCDFIATPSRDVVIWNNRANSNSAPFATAIKANNLDGSAVTINWKNADGTPLVAPDSLKHYDFSWDHANQRLAVLDASGRRYWIFSPTAPVPPCPADFNGDGFPDGFDYDDYVACFEGVSCPPGKSADFNNDGFADGFDYDDFVLAFETGCP